jgi:regulator of sigma E protease
MLGNNLLGFLIAVAILVTVHEFGHYLVARWCGVTVHRFSVGFGPVLLRWRGKRSIFRDTEFAVSALPLGGYVRMLDTHDPEFAKTESTLLNLHTAFDKQVLWKRSLIVAAGPFANFLLAGFLYALALSLPGQDLVPVVAAPAPSSAAYEAGLRGGERVVSIDDRVVKSWGDVRWQLLSHLFAREFALVATSGGIERTYVLKRADVSVGLDQSSAPNPRLVSWGLAFDQPAILGRVVDEGPAAKAGLRSGDQIVAVNENPVRQWNEFTQAIQKRAEQPTQIRVLRGGSSAELNVTPRKVEASGATLGRIDVTPIDPTTLGEQWVVNPQRDVFSSVLEGAHRAVEATWLTVRALWGMVTGEISLRQVSGPISMAEGAGTTLKQGSGAFILFLAIVSVSIGVLNLLPVPMLDGGQLLYHFIEAIKGAPLSERVEALGQRVGIGFIAALTGLALYNDFLRMFS